MNKYFNICNLYFLVWVLYSLQGSLYASGSMISQGFLAIFLLISIYYTVQINVEHKTLPRFLKVLNVFLLMITGYGIAVMLDPQVIYFAAESSNAVPKHEFLKTTYFSLLPIYVFYYFTKKGLLTENVICFFSIVILVVTSMSFVHNEREYIAAMVADVSSGEITNNSAYDFLALLPLLFFWNKRPLVQYAMMAYSLMFIIEGLKRGAIIISIVCIIWFLYRTWKDSGSVKRLFIVALTTVGLFVGFRYVGSLYETNDYFQYRFEATLDSNSSGRDAIFTTLWNYFINQTSLIKIIFGNGALQTINVAGNYAHNDWLEIVICHGLMGVLIYIAYFVALVKQWYNSQNNTIVYNVLGMSIFILFASTLFSMSYNSIGLAVSMCIGYCLAISVTNKGGVYAK